MKAKKDIHFEQIKHEFKERLKRIYHMFSYDESLLGSVGDSSYLTKKRRSIDDILGDFKFIGNLALGDSLKDMQEFIMQLIDVFEDEFVEHHARYYLDVDYLFYNGFCYKKSYYDEDDFNEIVQHALKQTENEALVNIVEIHK